MSYKHYAKLIDSDSPYDVMTIIYFKKYLTGKIASTNAKISNVLIKKINNAFDARHEMILLMPDVMFYDLAETYEDVISAYFASTAKLNIINLPVERCDIFNNPKVVYVPWQNKNYIILDNSTSLNKIYCYIDKLINAGSMNLPKPNENDFTFDVASLDVEEVINGGFPLKLSN